MIKKRMIIISSVIVAMLIIYIGFSYAAFQSTAYQQNENVISTTSCLSLEIEALNDELNINGYPLQDKDGLNQTPYTFSVTNNCSHYMQIDIGFELALSSTLGADQIRVSLNKSGKGKTNYGLLEDYPVGVAVNEGDERVLLTTTLEDGETKTFDYRMWIAYNQEVSFIEDMGLTGNIVVTGTIKTKPEVICTDTAHSTPVQGDEYVNGPYTYRYRQEGAFRMCPVFNPNCNADRWLNMTEDGWGVLLTNLSSTDLVNAPICSIINGKPVISMAYMFASSNASSIDLSTSDTSHVTNMSSMFFNSAALSINMRNINLSNVTDMGNMFDSASFASLNMSNVDTSNVENMSNMFYGVSMANLNLSGLDTSSVTDMSNMFQTCTSTVINVSNFDTSNVTYMEGMFSETTATSIDVSNFDTSNVTSMYSMFADSSATSLDLSNFDTSSVTDMSFMFSGSGATSLNLTSFDTSNVTTMESMFANSSAATLDLRSFDTSSVENMDFMFDDAAATFGYARNYTDLDRYYNYTVLSNGNNPNTYIPASLHLEVLE